MNVYIIPSLLLGIGIGRCINLNFKPKNRRGLAAAKDILMLIIVFAVGAILAGSILVSGLGTFANQTQGNACKNCDSLTKTLLPNVSDFIVIGVMLAFIGAAIGVFVGHSRGSI